MYHIKIKRKILLLRYLCILSILISITSSDSSLSVFTSHAAYINQTEIELIVSDHPDDIRRDNLNTSPHQFWNISDEFVLYDRFRDILNKYNLLIQYLYKVQKNVNNSNQGTSFFLNTKCRNRLSSDNDQSLNV